MNIEVLMRGFGRKFKLLIVNVVSASIALAPLSANAASIAQERQAEEWIRKDLVDSGLTSKTPPTLGEFYAKRRDRIPENARAYMDIFVSLNRNERMPKLEIQKIKDANDKIQYKLFFKRGKDTMTVTTADGYIKFGDVRFGKEDYANLPGFYSRLMGGDQYLRRMATKQLQDPKSRKGADFSKVSLVVTAKEAGRMTMEDWGTYTVRLRMIMEDAETILNPQGPSAQSSSGRFDVVTRWFAGLPAFAVREGQSCMISGYIDVYGDNGRCAGGKRTAGFVAMANRHLGAFGTSKTCQGNGSYPCNPLVYGFGSGATPHCVSGDLTHATDSCGAPDKSPLGKTKAERKANARRIVESWLEAKGVKEKLIADENGDIDPEQYKKISGPLEQLNLYVQDAIKHCDSPEGIKLQTTDGRKDQKSACDAIKTRLVDLKPFLRKCDIESGMEMVNGKCDCPAPKQIETDEGGRQLCRIPFVPPEVIEAEPEPRVRKKEKEECDWWCQNGWNVFAGALIVGATTGVILCVTEHEWMQWASMCRPNDPLKPPQYVPPVAPPGDLPPTNPPPPPVVPPPTVPTEGGSGTPPINSGGTR